MSPSALVRRIETSSVPRRWIDRKQRLQLAEERMEQLATELYDVVKGLETGVVDLSDIDPDFTR